MLRRFARLFVIKTRFEAMAVIYALAVGAVTRGAHYLTQYPGAFGYLMFAACTGAVFMAGAVLLERTRKDNRQRRRSTDRAAPRVRPRSSVRRQRLQSRFRGDPQRFRKALHP